MPQIMGSLSKLINSKLKVPGQEGLACFALLRVCIESRGHHTGPDRTVRDSLCETQDESPVPGAAVGVP